MPTDRPGPGLTADDAPGQIVTFEGVECVADETGQSPELLRAMDESRERSEAIGTEMLEACLTKSPHGNPYVRD